MSVRHRVALALSKYDRNASLAHETYEHDGVMYFVFEQEGASDMVRQMLRIMLKQKPLIHKGRKPR